MRRFSEMSQLRVGISGMLALAVLLVAAVNAGQIKSWFTGATYSAVFAEAGGLRAGNEVRIAGRQVGTVQSIALEGGHVTVTFSSDGPPLGHDTMASINTGTLLGTKFLKLDPAGRGELDPGATIPMRRTKSPYDVTEALSQLTKTTGRIDTDRLAKSFDTLADTFANTPPEVRDALQGMRRLSTTIAKRDEALRRLLHKAADISSVLRERNAQIIRLLTDGNALLRELETRRETIRKLLTGARQASDQLIGFVNDNAGSLGTALAKLQDVLAVLNKNLDSLDKAIQLVGRFGRALSEGLGSGPFFYAYLQNLPPTNLAPVLPSLFDGLRPNSGGRQKPGADQGTRDSPKPTPAPSPPELGELLPGLGGQQDSADPPLPLPGLLGGK